MKYWAFALIALVLIAGCDIPPAPAGKTETPEAKPTPTPVQTPPKATPVPSPEFIPRANTPSTAAELNISENIGTLAYKSPELKYGQWVRYKITTPDDVYERSYSVIEFFYQNDPCIGIERNSTKPGELRTQTMWCDDSKVIFTWSTKLGRFSDGQRLGESFWSDEAIQGFETRTSGLHEINVPAGTFWTLERDLWDGMTKKLIYGSPLVPGFEQGIVKKVESANAVTTTTELVAYGTG